MKTRCPTCKTRYEIDPSALLEADGLARCFRCGTVFETVDENAATTPDVIFTVPAQSAVRLDRKYELAHARLESAKTPQQAQEPPTTESAPDQDSGPPATDSGQEARPDVPASESTEEVDPEVQRESITDASLDPQEQAAIADENNGPQIMPGDTDPDPRPHDAESEPAEQTPLQGTPPITGQQPEQFPAQDPAEQLPFAVPEDLEPLEPSPDVAIDVVDTLYEKKSRRGFYYGLLAVLLIAGLGLQLAWQQRKELVEQYPLLQPLCEHIECIPRVIHAPELINVLQRDLKPTSNEPGLLTLSARIRNDANTAQRLPDIQLSLLDNNGAVLIRRRLTADDYLFPAPPKDKVMAPGEVVTITLDFKDPGYLASGFVIDFL